MEPKPATNYSTQISKHHLFAGSSSSQDPEITEVSLSLDWNPGRKKIQRSILLNEYGDHEPASAVIIGENTSDYKNKKPVGYDTDWQKQVQDVLSDDLMGSSTNNGLENDAQRDAQESSEPDADVLSDDLMGSSTNNGLENDAQRDAQESSEPDAVDSNSNHSGEDDDYAYDDDDYENYGYDTDMIADDCDYSLAAKFDAAALPPGVEATVPWLQKPAPERPRSDKHIVLEEEIDTKFKSLKQFDTVEDYSDHHFANQIKEVRKPPKDWVKKIDQDWKVLKKDLPETIFVRVYEQRMDLLRAVIIGPAGTPYHDGLFFFDFQFPSKYPYAPPKAYYHSGGLRLNPNLYACGKVCLSLLNTWSGEGCEKWDPQKSTMLQVLVSIQALVLNEKPYFNEPGYEMTAHTHNGQKNSLAYNETAFLYSCKTMMYSLQRPPKHFEDFVAGHFRKHGHTILVACRAYLDGTQVGCVVGEGGQDVAEGPKSSEEFRAQLKHLFEVLLMEFTVKGADCKEFLSQKAKLGDATAAPKAADTTLKL